MESVDWQYGAEHMWERHRIKPEWADEAVEDLNAAWADPDPKSNSGQSIRVIGYSSSAGAVLTVILLHSEDPKFWIGVNAWKANSTDKRAYRETP